MAAAAPGGMGGGTASLFGSGASPMPAGLSMAPPGGGGMNMPSGKAMQAASQMMGGDQQQPMPAQRPTPGQPQSQAEIMQRLKMMQGGRSNMAGLLGAAMGRA